MMVVEVPERLMPLLVSMAEHKRKALRAELAELDAFLRGQAGAPTEEAKDSKEAKDEVDEPAASAVDSAAEDPHDDDADTSTEHATEPAAGELARPAPLFERRGGRRPGVRAVSDDDFVAAWNAAVSPVACATALGMKKGTAQSRASILRKTRDVKRFPYGGFPKASAAATPTSAPPPEPPRPRPAPADGQVQCLGCFALVTPPKVRCFVCAGEWLKSRGEA